MVSPYFVTAYFDAVLVEKEFDLSILLSSMGS